MSVAISESDAGSDAAAMTTSAERQDDQVVLNGQKIWITKGDYADAFLVYAKFDDKIGAVIVDADTDGLIVNDGYENMAGHIQNDIFLNDCVVPEEHILALGDDAFKELLKEFNVERCHNAMMCVSCDLNAFDKALEHAQQREQFGQPLADFQGVEWKLSDMATKL